MRADVRLIHLNGPLNLDSREAFRLADKTLGGHLFRIPYGRLGSARGHEEWIFTGHRLFAESVEAPRLLAGNRHYRARRDVSAPDAELGDLGYAQEVNLSYGVLQELRQAGAIAANRRLQVTLPSPVALITNFVRHEDRALVEPTLQTALLGELTAILDIVPAADLAIQWDITVEFFTLETGEWSSWVTNSFAPLVEGLVRLGEAVPAGVELGYQLCYGNLDLRHLDQQATASRMFMVANGILSRLVRPVDWLHISIPADRTDPDYFTPLAGLRRFENTRIFLGLIHPDDDVDRAAQQLAAASIHIPEAGIGAFRPLGELSPENTKDMLALHRAVAEYGS